MSFKVLYLWLYNGYKHGSNADSERDRLLKQVPQKQTDQQNQYTSVRLLQYG